MSPAHARPNYLAAFKAHYKTADGKTTLNAANCSMCHVGAPNTGKWNAYGEAVREALAGKTRVNNQQAEAAIVAAESKRGPNARQTFGQRIATDRLPVGPAGGNAGAGDGGGAGAAATPAGPWENLFNGRDMSNFTVKNAGNWEVRNGILRYTGGGNGWLSTKKQYTNYAAVIIWRYPNPGDNDSGIFIKTNGNGSPWPDGPQLNMGPGQSIGSIGGLQGTSNRYDLIHPNDWNMFQITVQNGVVSLAINGQPAWDQGTGLSTGPGYIGVENEGKVIEINRFWVRPLQ
jgi:hypothetical protein